MISEEERKRRKIARKHKNDIRKTFINCGFEHIPTEKTNIIVAERTGELDYIFLYENILVVVESTTLTNQREIVEHLRKKHEFYEHLDANPEELFRVLKSKFPKFRGYLRRYSQYEWNEFNVFYLYCSLKDINDTYKNRYGDVCKFLDYPYLQYFLRLSNTIHKTACFEFMKFLGLKLKDIGPYQNAEPTLKYHGQLLPETPSGFPPGHKIVTFWVEPKTLLEQGYVLRAESWRDTECLYQRLLIKKKIENMREFLTGKKRVYLNNIIATLPAESKITDENGNVIEEMSTREIQDISIQIPRKFNTIGIIDGQHRVYSYHEGSDHLERKIQTLRSKQHLQVTAIVYPSGMAEVEKQQFEAELFVEINDKQKRVDSALKHSIVRILQPHSAVAISKAVLAKLAKSGPLAGMLEVHFYDVKKIKTASIVSFGMKHIVGLESEHSLYNRWRGQGKRNIKRNNAILQNYINHCASNINMLIAGFKEELPNSMWTTDQKISKALTITTINGLMVCLRNLIENNKMGDLEYYIKAFKKMKIKFTPKSFPYKSSHWKALGDKLFEDCF